VFFDDMPPDVEALAHRFIEAGGWFDVEAVPGHASLTAGFVVDDEPQDIAIRVVDNGPPVVRAVEELVRAAAAWLEDPPLRGGEGF
jgi:hypothetical protein